MNKTIITPLVAVICIALQTIFHVEVKEDLQGEVVNAVLVLATLYGVFKNHKKEGK